MEKFIILFSVFIIAVSLFIYYEQYESEIDFVKSNIDNKEYLVRKAPDQKKAKHFIPRRGLT